MQTDPARAEQAPAGATVAVAPPPAPGTAARLLPLMPAHLAGLGACQLALLLALLDLRLAAAPLVLFVLACAAAPFFPAWRFFGPVLTRGRRGPAAVALTFDDGPDPSTTPALLELLARHGVLATFFLVGERAARHPDLVRRMLAAGHRLGNHSATHDPLLMLRSRATLEREVAACQQILAGFGVRPLAFRPPVGIVSPRLWPVLLRHGMICVGFSRRGGDFGNRRVRGLVRRLLRRVRAGDVLLLHDGPLRDPAGVGAWLDELEQVLAGLQQRGLAVRPLEELAGRPLCEPLPAASRSADGPDPVARFYDGLAASYDAEQQCPSFSLLRRAEEQQILPRLDALLAPGDRVLEIGAGTGRFTLELARRASEVVAIELSAGMAAELERKLGQAGLGNVRVRTGDVRRLELGGPYRLVCAFSVFEYVRDLGELLPRLAAALQPGGTLLFTTARRSPLRLVVQLGNALRQGVWLEARSRGEVARLLRRAGLEPVAIEASGLRLPLLHRGMLLRVEARRA